ncbi:MAG: hypothetical protein GXY32_02305 [Ruminococcaceae bacterium]|nr:hypothetical protein [Oscillospiraceae bacterium]
MAVRVLMFQLKVRQQRDWQRSWVEYADVAPMMAHCFEIARRHQPDLVVFPETCYIAALDGEYRKLAQHSVVVAGSAYNAQSVNETHLYLPDGEHRVLPKLFPSPWEIMELNHPNQQVPDQVIARWEAGIRRGEWPPYFPVVDKASGKRLAILNCMDYYRLGYYVGNSSLISPHVWGMVSPCSNTQQSVFFRLSEVIHDTNERIYSIVVNSHNEARAPGSSQGESYVMGPITYNVKKMLEGQGQGKSRENGHFSFIYQLESEPEALMMDLIDGSDVRFFARSKDFYSNPTGITRIKLEGQGHG